MTNIPTHTVIDNTNNTQSSVINIKAQPNLNKEQEYRDVGRKLTKIIYNKNPGDDFKTGLNGKTVIVFLPKLESNESNENSLIMLRRYIIDIALQAKVHDIQIDIVQL